MVESYLGRDFGEFLVQCIGDVMRGISGQDQDTLTYLGQLNGQTATVEGSVEMGD